MRVLGFIGGSAVKESACNGIQSLGWEDPVEEKTATHSSILSRKNPTDRGA